MSIRDKYQEEVSNIVGYYNRVLGIGDNLVLVGLNDDRGFNFQKNILAYMKQTLQSGNYDMTVIDAYSMFFNKTRHIDYYLRNNLSLQEIELMKQYGTVNEICHAVGNNSVVRAVAKVISRHLPNPSSSDKSLKLSDTIKEAKSPIIVYSSGINDIMFQTCINPFSAKGYYFNDKEKYEYAVSRVSGSKGRETMKTLMDGHKSNFDKILGINDGSKICSLGAYLYSDGQEYDKIFHEFVLAYNEELEKLCKQYGINYVSTRLLEDTKFQNAAFTYFSSVSKILAGEVLKELNKGLEIPTLEVPQFEYTDRGAAGVLSDMVNYRDDLFNEDPYFYDKKEKELSREEDVFSKVVLEGVKSRVLKR